MGAGPAETPPDEVVVASASRPVRLPAVHRFIDHRPADDYLLPFPNAPPLS
jgi:hypothetical protein